MIETMKAPFNHGRVYIVLYLCGLVLINILPFTCLVLDTAYAEPVFSAQSTNEPLYKVLAKISRATGYKIAITKSWENQSITVNIKNSTLEEGIKKIINLIGNPNYAMVTDDRLKKVEIRIFDTSSGDSSVGANRPVEHRQRQNEGAGIDAGAKPNFIYKEVMPPPPKLELPPENAR